MKFEYTSELLCARHCSQLDFNVLYRVVPFTLPPSVSTLKYSIEYIARTRRSYNTSDHLVMWRYRPHRHDAASDTAFHTDSQYNRDTHYISNWKNQNVLIVEVCQHDFFVR